MDYIRISSQRSAVSGQCMVTEPVEVPVAHSSQLTAEDIKNLLKDWIKLYPNSFAPDVEFKVYQLADGDIIIQLHEDLSSMAVSLLVLYFDSIGQQTTVNRQQTLSTVTEPTAYITIDDTEVLLKQNEGKRAMVIGQRTTDNSQQTLGKSRDVTPVASENKMSDVASVRFILEDNYVLDYNFEKRAQPVKDCDMVFEEPEFSLLEEYESVRVGDVVKKKIDEILDEGLTPKKLLMYFLCGAIGLGIGFLIVYFMSK